MDVNEAISAVADEGFIGEEEDDDYEDLYNDVNVGENFLQSLRRKEDVSTASATTAGVEKKPDPAPAPAPAPAAMEASPALTLPQQPAVERRVEDGGLDPRVSGRGEKNYQGNLGYRAPGVPSGGGFRVELGQSTGSLPTQQSSGTAPNQPIVPQHNSVGVGNLGNTGNDSLMRQVAPSYNTATGNVNVGSSIGGGGGGGNGSILFVGELHWWTTDAELETELSKYGPVKEVKFFDERASGKSKGYCQVEFYDPIHATSCKEGMNGHLFNGRPCVVAFASPFSIKKMGDAQVNRNQQMGTGGNNNVRKGPGDLVGKPGGSNIVMGANYQGGVDNNNNNINNNYNNNRGRGNWGRGNNQGMGRGGAGPMRRGGGGMGGRGTMGNGGGGFNQGIGATPPMMHPFDPAYGGPMARMGGYGGFPGAPTPPFSGMFSSFPPVGGVGLPGVAPHVNPAFFRGMPMNGMNMMPGGGVEGPNMGMWPDPNMGGWGGEEHGGRAGESSYAEEAISDHQYGESHDRGTWQGGMKEKDRGSERDWSGSSERRVRDDREVGYDRDTRRENDAVRDHDWSERGHRNDRAVSRDRERDRDRGRERSRDRDRDRSQDRHRDHHRYKERDSEYDDERARGRLSRAHS